ncbi:kinase-like protein [Stipitochalara longipes BDJ]|nr:kinase-like protein [Stipitochalara longipes BDJ]
MRVPCRYNKPLAQNNGPFFGGLAKIRRHLKDKHQITHNVDTWIEECSEEPVESLAEQLLSAQIEEPKESNAYFIPIDQLNKLLIKSNVRQQLRKIFPTMEDESVELYTDSICSTSKKLFAALICSSSGAQSRAISNFIQEGIDDTDLPFSRLYLSDKSANLSGRVNQMYTLARDAHVSCTRTDHASCGINAISNWSRDQVQSLSRDQWRVLAPIFESTPGTTPPHLHISDSAVLPFTEDHENDPESVKFGGYSEVWAVRIHPAHQKMLRSTSRSPEPLIAVKRLISREPEVFERERRMLSQLTLKNHPHLVRLLITYTYKGKFHLLYPYAQCNLRDYWRKQAKPGERDTCLWALQQICGLASALNQIHNFSTKPDMNKQPERSRERPGLNIPIDTGEEMFGRHGDLKPENILWLSDLEEVDPLGILQITDFGLGRFHRLESRSLQDPASINGSPTYCPPELLLMKLVSRAYDIWSLGCLYLEFITWIINGNDGVEAFADARLAMAFDGITDDTYYTLVISGTERRAEVREAVTTWMERLRSNQYCSQAIKDLLDLVQNRMLQVESGDRIRAKELDSTLRKMLERAKADTAYLLGDHPRESNGDRSSIVSTASTSTIPSKHGFTLTDRTRSHPTKRRLKSRTFER